MTNPFVNLIKLTCFNLPSRCHILRLVALKLHLFAHTLYFFQIWAWFFHTVYDGAHNDFTTTWFFRCKLDSLKRKLDSLKRKIDSLKRKLDSLKRKLDSLKRKLESLKRKLESLERKLDSLKRKLDSLKSKLDSLKRKLDSLKRKLDSLKRKLDSLGKWDFLGSKRILGKANF